MEFCSKCKILMIPKGNIFVCSSCGAEKKRTGCSVIVQKQRHHEPEFVGPPDKYLDEYVKGLDKQNGKSR